MFLDQTSSPKACFSLSVAISHYNSVLYYFSAIQVNNISKQGLYFISFRVLSVAEGTVFSRTIERLTGYCHKPYYRSVKCRTYEYNL